MPSGNDILRPLQPGDSPFRGPLAAAQWNGVVQTVRAVRRGMVPGLTMQGGGQAGNRQHPTSRMTIGVIDSSDPGEGWPDFSGDNRYWVRVWTDHAQPAKGAGSASLMDGLNIDSVGDYAQQIPATNLAERRHGEKDSGSHLLSDGTIVTLWQVVVGDQVQWVFWQPVEDRILARITGDSGAAHSWEELEVTGVGTMGIRADGEERSGTDNAYEFNGRESVPIGTIVWIDRIWDWANDAETFWFDLAMGEDTGTGGTGAPVRFDLTFAGEHQETSRGSATAWHIENQGETRGIKIRVTTGIAYNHAGDEKLYEYFVELEFDANGHLWSVSDETRVEIDAPEDC